MIDFASTRQTTPRENIPSLKLMAAVIAQAVDDATARPVSTKSRTKGSETKRSEVERNAESAIRFLFTKGGQFDRLAGFVGFEPDDMRKALLVGNNRRFGISQYDDKQRRVLRWRMDRLGYDMRKYTTKLEYLA